MQRAFGPGLGPAPDVGAEGPRSAARIEDSRILHLEAHLSRIRTASEAIGHEPGWLHGLGEDLAEWVGQAAPPGLQALRLLLQDDLLWARVEALSATPQPYRLAVLPHPLPQDHPLAPHKGLTGPWRTDVLAAARALGADDALLCWPDHACAETAIAAIALEADGRLWIPPLRGRVASLAERLDLPGWAAARGLRCETRAFTPAELQGRQLWCFNALRGFWPANPIQK